MNNQMLLAVLRMPIECWPNDHIDTMQRHQRYLEAADLIEALPAENQCPKCYDDMIRIWECPKCGHTE